MERPTHAVETPVDKIKVVLKDWLTGGEKRNLSNQDSTSKKQEALMLSLVVSVNDETAEIIQKMDAMHGKDFDFVLLELAKIAGDSSLPTEKKTP